ncbi:MAG: glycosyltransferase, partial [Candidatus Heimdallarchaeota archaeon]
MISIVVPVYNEESNVEPLFNEIVNVIANGDSEVEVIFVDDGSQDNTLKKLKALQANQSTSQVKL